MSAHLVQDARLLERGEVFLDQTQRLQQSVEPRCTTRHA